MTQVDKTKHYLGNPNLKAEHVSIQFTKEQLEEYTKCAEDPIYFIENYVHIINVDEGLVKFEMWPFQKKMVKLVNKNRFTICKLSRQCGKSTTLVSYLLWVILFQKLQSVAILANKASAARGILARLQFAYERIPKWMQQGVKEWNKGSIILENGSKIIAASTASSSARGDTYNIILLDEFAFVPRNIADEFITSVYPTISSGKSTKVIMVSTPNGMNLFYKYWTDAQEKRNAYIPFEAHFSEVPGRDPKWEKLTRANLGDEKFEQEFGTDFLGATNTLINKTKLQELVWKPPTKKYKDGPVIYKMPEENHTYVLVADTAEGQGLDCSAFSVIDVTETPYRQVATYRSNDVSPLLYPDVIYNSAKMYNHAHVLIEVNSIGSQIASSLYNDLEYESIFATTTQGRGGQKISAGFKKKSKLGIKTTESLKKIGCANLKSMVEGNQLILEDFDTVSELTSFTRHKKTYAAEEGCNDDLAMGLVFFGWLSSQQYFKDLTNMDIRKKLYADQAKNLEEDMLPDIIFGDEDDESFVDSKGERWYGVDDDETSWIP